MKRLRVLILIAMTVVLLPALTRRGSLPAACAADGHHRGAVQPALVGAEALRPVVSGAALGSPGPSVRPVPEAVSAEEWATIQAGIRRAEYQFTWHEPSSAHTAQNRAHGWRVAFAADGVKVTPHGPSSSQGQGGRWYWRLRLLRYGYQGQLQTVAGVPAQRVDANRVEYRHADGELVEWYLNDERGLEQGFSLMFPPSRRLSAPLHIEMAFSGNLTPGLADDRQAILFADTDGAAILHYSGLHVSDATGRQLPAHFELLSPSHGEGPRLRVVADDRGAVYPIIVDPLLTSQVAKLTASDGAASDFFGSSVAVSGDTVVVGAPYEDGPSIFFPERGAAYVFERNEGGAGQWGQVKKLTASFGAANDKFGSSVAISGDNVVVGAVGHGSDKGTAYVFERNEGGADNWGEVKKLNASDGTADDSFGISVGISGDTVVVGAYRDDGFRGSAYVFERNRGGADNWGEVRKLTASDGLAGDDFGWSVGISGDTIVVGASYDEVGTHDAQGSAYVFERNQGGADQWGQVKKLTASDGLPVDVFGISVGISGDTVVVGAYHDDNQGSAYVFERNQGGADQWGQVKKLTASDRAAEDRFGWSVGISGDTVVVGAGWDDVDDSVNQGSAYVFERNQGGADSWGEVTKLTGGDSAPYDLFGISVAISGDTIVVGADHDDVGANELQGSAYAFVRTSDAWEQEQKRTASDGAANDWFGTWVAVSGDTTVVGAIGDESFKGVAYVFARNRGGANQWGQVRKLTANDGESNDRFGTSVGISGDIVVVGAPHDDSYRGSAYVFERNRGGADNWGQVKKLTVGDGAAFDYFGISVAISGDTIVVGANLDDDKGANSGSAYVFERNQGGADNWGRVRKLTASDGTADDYFGLSVAISGDTVVVGAPYDDAIYFSERGSAYVFTRNQGGADRWGEVKKLSAGNGTDEDRFGSSVAISGDTVVVGAPYHDGPFIFFDVGSAYVFERNQGGADNWGEVPGLGAGYGTAYDTFGNSVAISGDTVVVAAVGYDDDKGTAYVFERNQGGADNWGQVKKLNASDGATNDVFGRSVTLSGHTVVIGASGDDVGAKGNQGSCYIFRLGAPAQEPVSIFLPVVTRQF